MSVLIRNTKTKNTRLDNILLPMDISGLTLWLDVSVFASLTFNGGDISQIDDLSGDGNNFEQTTAANQPTYATNQQNGLPTLSFNGTSDYIKCINNFVSTDSDTWFFVFQSDLDGDANATVLSDYGDVGSKFLVVRGDNDGTQDVFYARDGNNDYLQLSDPLVSAYSLLVTTRQPGAITMNYNDAESSTSGTYISTAYDGGNVPHIGCQGGAALGSPVLPNAYLKGHFAYALRYERVLNAIEINKVIQMIKKQWGL